MTTQITDQNFEDLIKNNSLVLVDFWAEWCGPCKVIGPVLEEISNDFFQQVIIGKINVDENPNTAVKFGIRSIPTLLLFKDGELVDKQVGAGNKGGIIALINKHL